jgi:NhaP-type Na+/H+ or K+/H+ antiporter
MENFWDYMAHLANALIFLLVGLRVEIQALAGSLDLLLWVLLAMLFSRAVAYGTAVRHCRPKIFGSQNLEKIT